MYVDPSLVAYAVTLAEVTRDPEKHGLTDLDELIAYRRQPARADLAVHAARALALVHGRDYVLGSDIKALVKDAFRHRLVLTYRALAEETSPDDILDQVIRAVASPPLELGRPKAA